MMLNFFQLFMHLHPLWWFWEPRMHRSHTLLASPSLWISLQISHVLFWPSIMATWTMHFGCVENLKKALHIWLDELYLRLEMCKGSLLLLLFYFLSLQILFFSQLSCSDIRIIKEINWKLIKFTSDILQWEQIISSGAEESLNEICNCLDFDLWI